MGSPRSRVLAWLRSVACRLNWSSSSSSSFSHQFADLPFHRGEPIGDRPTVQDLGQLIGLVGFQNDRPGRYVAIGFVVEEHVPSAVGIDQQAESTAGAGDELMQHTLARDRRPIDLHSTSLLEMNLSLCGRSIPSQWGATPISVGQRHVWTMPSLCGHSGGVNPRVSVVSRFRGRTRTPAGALFRRLFVINGLVFTLGTLALALSPATVSARIRLTEIPVLVVGLAVILAANAFLLRSSLAPLDDLARSMGRVDPPHRSDRLDDRGNGDLHDLIASFNAMLDRLETERSSATGSALAAQEGERARIARELHDEIGQSLTVALLALKRAVDKAPIELRGDLHHAQEAVRASLDEVRGIASRLRPDVLEDLGLHSALNALCSEFTQATRIDVVRHIYPRLARLDPNIELVCYRVAQEALTNIARHAGAQEVHLDLHVADDHLTLCIVDDGKGGVVADGAGIKGMRERALLVGATLGIDSPSGEGTKVRLVVPLRVESSVR
ncbi:two-component sensor histidine kinase (plasmid) [Rhodococcus sp. WAY2]|nr:two-component sensor histidine kinase [Rhodococcus sp. WAY2]